MNGDRRYQAGVVVVGLPTAIAIAAAATATIVTGASFFGFAHLDGAAIKARLVQAADGGLGAGFVGHGYETEAAGTTGVAIGDDGHVGHFTEFGEGLTQAFIGRVPAQTTNVHLCIHFSYLTFLSRRRNDGTIHLAGNSARSHWVGPNGQPSSCTFHTYLFGEQTNEKYVGQVGIFLYIQMRTNSRLFQ